MASFLLDIASMPRLLLSRARARVAFFCLGSALVLAACPDEDDEIDDTRARGDLGRGRFVYECFNQTDTACEDGAAELPKALAVGGRFALRFAIESGAQPSVIAPSFDFVRRVDGGFQVRAAGDFALLAVNGNREVIDIKHLYGADIAEVRVQRNSELPATSLQLKPGESVELLAVPFDAQGAELGGALDYAWHSEDEQLLRVESLAALNRVRVRAGAESGTLQLSLEVAGTSHAVSVRIGSGEREPDAGADAAEPEEADGGLEENDAQAEADAAGGES
jgi:hypothetical protein